jgi:membrane protease YdiL (CAAX protease family)
MPQGTSGRRVIAAVLVAVLIGATLFGLWHLIVGGLLNGNPRAGTFGFLLAAVAGSFLGGLAVGLRRLRPG